MTDDTESAMDSTDRFIAMLESVLADAYRNDVDIEGGWLIRTHPPDGPNWDIEIWQVDTTDGSE